MDEGDYLHEYPDVDENLSKKLYSKKEYYDYKLKPREPIPSKPGSAFNHQELQKRFFSPFTQYRKGILFHAPGTGKCMLPDTSVNVNGYKLTMKSVWDNFKTRDFFDEESGVWASTICDLYINSYDITTKKVVSKKITHLFCQYIHEPIKIIVLSDNTHVKCTLRHKIRTLRGFVDNPIENDIAVCISSDGNVEYKRILSVTKRWYEGFVYDFEVSKNHCYFANDVLCHNTCTVSLIVEHIKSCLKGRSKKALILEPNDVLVRSIRNKIAKVCTEEEKYNPLFYVKDQELITERTRKQRVKKLIERTYIIETYHKVLQGQIGNMDGMTIIVDEIHNFRKNMEKNDKVPPYDLLEQFIKKHLDNSVIILMTGTLIHDSVDEFASVYNLLVQPEEKLPTGRKFINNFFTKDRKLINQDILKKKIAGLFSYLRPMETTAVELPQGVTKVWTKYMYTYPSIMSDFQYRYAKESLDLRGASALNRDGMEAAIFVFPVLNDKGKLVGGKYGTKAFHEYIHFSRGKWRYRSSNVLNYIISNLRQCSCVFAALIEKLKQSPNDVAYVHNDFVTGGAGLINLGIILEHSGFKQISYSNPEIDAAKIDSETRRFSIMSHADGTIKNSDKVASFLEMINQPTNTHGNQCQVIMGSRTVSVGIDIFNARAFHCITPWWNMAVIEQARGRVFRPDSHIWFKKNESYVKTYYHISVKKYNPDTDNSRFFSDHSYPPNIPMAKEPSITTMIYRKAEVKEEYNAPIFRLVKEMSWDCPLTYRRNVLKGDVTNSRQCNFDECNYICSGFSDEDISTKTEVWKYRRPEIDYTTYNMWYHTPDPEEVKLLEEYLSNNFLGTVKQLEKYVTPKNRVGFLMTIATMISERRIIYNLYGYPCYISEYKNIIFLSKTINGFPTIFDSVYSKNPMFVKKKSLSYLISTRTNLKDLETIEKYSKNINGLLKNISFDTKRIVLEEAYTLFKTEENPSPFVNKVLKEMSKYIHEYKGTLFHIMAYYINGVKPTRIIPSELTRVYDPDKNKWYNLDNVYTEEELFDSIKEVTKQKVEDIWENNPYNVSGEVDDKGRFKLLKKVTEGRKRPGIVCITTTKEKIFEIFKEIDYYPEVPEMYEIGYEESLDIVNNSNLIKKVFGDVKSKKKIESLAFMEVAQKETLCRLLKSWLEERELMNK